MTDKRKQVQNDPEGREMLAQINAIIADMLAKGFDRADILWCIREYNTDKKWPEGYKP